MNNQRALGMLFIVYLIALAAIIYLASMFPNAR